MTRSADSRPDNEVFLRGRLAASPTFRDLPSGDVLAVFRITVTRPAGDRARVDSIECTTVRVRPHRTLAKAGPGDELELVGSLHRRFWRSPAGAASRYSVDADTVRAVRAARRASA